MAAEESQATRSTSGSRPFGRPDTITRSVPDPSPDGEGEPPASSSAHADVSAKTAPSRAINRIMTHMARVFGRGCEHRTSAWGSEVPLAAMVALAVFLVHLVFAPGAPVLVYGDSSLARTLLDSGPVDVYPILTSLGRVPIYPRVTGLGWALDPGQGRPILVIHVLFMLTGFGLTLGILDRS